MQDESVKKRVVISEVWMTQEASLGIIIDFTGYVATGDGHQETPPFRCW